MTTFDSFMLNDELAMLECRLVELENVPDLIHVIVEADVDHQDHPKPYHFKENEHLFSRWADRIVSVQATDLPTHADEPDPWAREHAQREKTWLGLAGAKPDDVILHGDLDEIPTDFIVRNIAHMRPNSAYVFRQKMCCFAVDWMHPDPWNGTVAAHLGGIQSFGAMRDWRNRAMPLQNGGWHFSWLGGKDAALRKLDSFCHPEIAGRTREGIERDIWLDQGWHVDGEKCSPVEVDSTWPRYIAEGRCPPEWFRPRDVEATLWRPPMGVKAS